MRAPWWAPMVAPPLPCGDDVEYDTCPHAYPAEECMGLGQHLTVTQQETLARRQRDVDALIRLWRRGQ